MLPMYNMINYIQGYKCNALGQVWTSNIHKNFLYNLLDSKFKLKTVQISFIVAWILLHFNVF